MTLDDTLIPGTPEGSVRRAAFSWEGVRVGVLANAASGQSAGAETVAERVIAALRASGAEIPDASELAEKIPGQMDVIRETEPDVVVAIGGDGTVNAGGRLAIGLNAPLLVVPTGTMNLVARDLGIAQTFERQLADMATLIERRIDYATVNGEIFLHSSALGFVPRMAKVREQIRKSEGWGEKAKHAARFVGGIFTVGARRLSLHSDAGRAVRDTRSLLVTCNHLADAGVGEHKRTALDEGVLGVYASAHAGPLAAVQLSVTFALGGFTRDRQMDCGGCHELEVRTQSPSASVSNDGELLTLKTPLHFDIHARGLRVLVARPEPTDPPERRPAEEDPRANLKARPEDCDANGAGGLGEAESPGGGRPA